MLTSKDKKDIDKKVIEMLNANKDLDEHTKPLFEKSIREAVTKAKLQAKEKYTPKKYK